VTHQQIEKYSNLGSGNSFGDCPWCSSIAAAVIFIICPNIVPVDIVGWGTKAVYPFGDYGVANPCFYISLLDLTISAWSIVLLNTNAGYAFTWATIPSTGPIYPHSAVWMYIQLILRAAYA